VESQVLVDERRDEVVAVVVAFAHSQVEGDAGALACFAQKMRLELPLEESVACALIDEDRAAGIAGILDQRRRVVRAPCRAIVAEVAGERLLPHGQRIGETIGANAETDP